MSYHLVPGLSSDDFVVTDNSYPGYRKTEVPNWVGLTVVGAVVVGFFALAFYQTKKGVRPIIYDHHHDQPEFSLFHL